MELKDGFCSLCGASLEGKIKYKQFSCFCSFCSEECSKEFMLRILFKKFQDPKKGDNCQCLCGETVTKEDFINNMRKYSIKNLTANSYLNKVDKFYLDEFKKARCCIFCKNKLSGTKDENGNCLDMLCCHSCMEFEI